MSDQEILLQARDLIKAKQYQDARNLLEPIAQNPTAQKWLAKLDEIAPKPKAQESYFDELPPATPEKPDLPAGKPWNPTLIAVTTILFIPISIIGFALNWHKLGKSWMVLTLMFDGFLLFGMIGSRIWLSQTEDNFDIRYIPRLLVITFIVAHLLFSIILWYLQRGSYSKWLQGDINGMLDHRYNLGIVLIIWLVATILIGGVGGVQILSLIQPTTWENDQLSLEYRLNWQIISSDKVQGCRDLEYGCFLSLIKEGDYSQYRTAVNLSQYPLSDYAATFPEFIANLKSEQLNDEYQFLTDEETIIKNAAAYWYDL